MKKPIILPLAFLIFNFSFLAGFAQSTSDKEIVKLSNDIKTLNQKNNKLKKEVTENVTALKKSIDDIKGLYQGTNDKISSVTTSLTATNSAVSALQDETHKSFLSYKSTLKTSIIIALLVMLALTCMIIMLFSKLKKEREEVNKSLDMNEKVLGNLNEKLTELNDELSRNINGTHETLMAKINETYKLIDTHLRAN